MNDKVQALAYETKAQEATVQAATLTHLADETLTAALLLHDSDPGRRCGIRLARAYRDGANALTDAADTWQLWATDHLVHADSQVSA